MSNKIVPAIYRAVIDDVIASIKSDFDEYGVSEDVLADLQSKWENKVIASHVAEFEVPQPQPPPPPPPTSYPPHPMHAQPQHGYHYAQPPPPPPPQAANVKAEPTDSRHILSTYPHPHMTPHYALPALPGPQMAMRPPTAQQPVQHQPYAAQAGRPGSSTQPVRPYGVAPGAYQPPPPAPAPQATARIPQLDGPSSSGSESGSSPPQQYVQRGHMAPPDQRTSGQADDEAINSDLDDSDSEGDDDAEDATLGETDIVFCTYDKVARVKNKWKCILKDGMIHVNGKDYLFGKCSGEFEW